MVSTKKTRRVDCDKLFDLLNYVTFTLIVLSIIYPLYWVCIASISDPNEVILGRVILLPHGATLAGYRAILKYNRLWLGFRNTLFYTVFGTLFGLMLTLSSGYVASRKDFVGRKLFLVMITITMFFGGGLIPTYLLIKRLGMVNTPWAMIIPGCCTAYNILVTKSFFSGNLPDEILESAMIDGSSNIRFFFQIALPISLPLIAVITIFTAVGYWNSYTSALIYLRDDSLYPLQMILREILVQEDANRMLTDISFMEKQEERRKLAELIKYGTIIISTLPLLIAYPFLQRFFVKGIMVGSIKG